MNWELLLVAFLLLAILIELRRLHRRLTCIEAGFRGRDELIVAALRTPRHLRAINGSGATH